MIELGDCFKSIIYTFKVVEFLSSNLVECEVYVYNRRVSITSEHRNTLLRMQKLSSLEKELM
jgi:hypothetical protein